MYATLGPEIFYSSYVSSQCPSCYMNIGWAEKGREKGNLQMEEQAIEKKEN